MKSLIINAILTILIINSFGQINSDELMWCAGCKLTLDDFGVKKADTVGLCFVNITIKYSVNRFDFISSRNLNNKVKNIMMISSSWIDTTFNIEIALRYAQTSFDLMEIYARKFRKELNECNKPINKKEVEKLHKKILYDYKIRHLQYYSDTNRGFDKNIQNLWETEIKKELAELADYAFEGIPPKGLKAF